MTAALPTVTVIVPVRDDTARLTTCVSALLEQTYPDGLYDVVVIDNGSTEPVADALPDDDRLTLLHEPTPGSYAARNTGLAAARGEVLAFTDSDCIPSREWLQRAVEALVTEPTADMVGGRVELFYAGDVPVTGAELVEARDGFPQERYLRYSRFAVTANMLVWRRVLDRVGPFAADLTSGGDAEFGARVAEAGGLQRYAAEAVVRHPARASAKELFGKARRTAVGKRDMHRGAGPAAFLVLARGQLRVAARELIRVTVLRQPPEGLLPKMRFLSVYEGCRAIQLATYLSAAAASLKRDGRTRPGS